MQNRRRIFASSEPLETRRFLSGSIAGKVFEDKNSNSVYESDTELGQEGWTVYLDANNNNTLDTGETSALTDVDGNYLFSDVAPGSYYVREIGQATFRRSLPAPPYNYYLATITVDEAIVDRNFGNTHNILISGVVYSDNNNDGVLNGGDIGLVGVRAFIDLNNSGTFDDGEPNRTTNAEGLYQFKGLSAGTGTLLIEKPEGYDYKNPATGSYSGTMTAGQQNQNLHFGLVPVAAPLFSGMSILKAADGISVEIPID